MNQADPIIVTLISETENSTLSLLKYKGFKCFVIEDGKREKKIYGETRIPGLRSVLVGRRSGGFFERYKKLFGHEFSLEIKNVPGFKWVLLHIGNFIRDTKGCLLLNYGCRLLDGVFVGIDSKNAYKDFYDLVAPEIKKHGEVPIIIER